MWDNTIEVYPGPGGATTSPMTVANVGGEALIANNGPANAYLGGPDVTAVTGLLLPPSQQIRIMSVTAPVYVVSDPGSSGSTSATLSEAIAAGALSLPTLTNSSYVDFGPGVWVLINDGAASEVIACSGGTTETAIPVYSGTRFPHTSGASVVTVSGTLTSIHTVSDTDSP